MPLVLTRSADGKTNNTAAKRASRLAEAGQLRRIYAGIYTNDTVNPLEVVTRRELYALCAILAPEALISHRSALDQGPAPNGEYFLTGSYRRNIELPGVHLKIMQGPQALASDIRIPTPHGVVYRSSEARAFLENLQPSRTSPSGSTRTLGRGVLEDLLETRLATHGEAALNKIRETARVTAAEIGFDAEFKELDRILSALLGSREHKLTGRKAIARAAGKPYDGRRVDLFDQLLTEYGRHPVAVSPADIEASPQLSAFVESYFSNYIEGTEFELAEARGIVLDGKPMIYREDDSHDVLGTYDAILQAFKVPVFPAGYEEFFRQLCAWNRQVIQSRLAMRPGEIKEKHNRAGNTLFVTPEDTRGTLEKGFERIMAAEPGAARAAMTLFVVAEVHPFSDGNGRTARLAMNLVLSAHGLTRIIVPTVFRDDYLLALKALSNSADATPYLRMLTRAASFSGWLNLRSEDACFKQLHASNALKKPAEGKLAFASHGRH